MTPYLRIFLLLILIASGPASSLQAQRKQQKLWKANVLFEAGAYPEAIRKYRKILKKDRVPEASFNLARCYRELGEYDNAELSFSEAALNATAPPAYKLEFGKFLKSRGKYEKARKWFEDYSRFSRDTAVGNMWARSCNIALDLKKDSLGYKIRKFPDLNSKNSEISPVRFGSGIAFATTRKRGVLFRFFNQKSRQPFYDLYFSQREPSGTFTKPKYLKKRINSRFHDGPTAFTPGEDQAFVTRNYMGEGKGRRDTAGVNVVNIYHLENREDRWHKLGPVPHGTSKHNIAHPAVSREGDVLIFASNKSGGYGGTDLYISRLEGEKWSKPENLGPAINSPYNEGYPCLTNDSLLYFTSDRPQGLGGKDIFYSWNGEFGWSQARNAGYPLNSAADDFAFFMRPDSPEGFFCSNRAGGQGSDDIYGFKRRKAIIGQIVDSRTLEPVPDTRVRIMDIQGKEQIFNTGPDGRFMYYNKAGDQVLLKAEKTDYQDYQTTLRLNEIGADEDYHYVLKLEEDRRFEVIGRVTDAVTGRPIKGATIRVIGKKEIRVRTRKDGRFQQEIQPETDYTVVILKDGYVPEAINLTTEGAPEPVSYDLTYKLVPGRALFLQGRVVDRDTKDVLDEVQMRIVDPYTHKVYGAFFARKDGLYWRVFDPNRDYSIVASRGGYLTTRYDLLSDSLNSDTVLVELELGKMMNGATAKVVYHGYDIADTDTAGKRDLTEIHYLLEDNPNIKVELSSHTDSRGSSRYNQKLSQKRAEAVTYFLRESGVDSIRIEAKGYGETMLLNECKDGVKCEEEAHSLNRRTEVKVLAIDLEEEKPIGKDPIKGYGKSGKDLIKGEKKSGKGEIKEGIKKKAPDDAGK